MTQVKNQSKLQVFPLTAEIDAKGLLNIGGVSVSSLVEEFGSPLYVFDEFTLRNQCRLFREEFGRRYQNTSVVYACKAFTSRALVSLIKEEGLGLDVVSGGEASVANSAAFPMEWVYFHGNNKTLDELKLAFDLRLGKFVVDNLFELECLEKLASERGVKQEILIRVNPGVDAHTHRYTNTAILDSKFGLPLDTSQAETAVVRAIECANLDLIGLHFHLGSPVTEVLPYELAIDKILYFAATISRKHGFVFKELNIGGGFAVQYTTDVPVLTVAEYADAIVGSLLDITGKLGIARPRLVIEPGRAIVAQAGTALYKVGAIKDIPGVRKYVCVDGGMGDNIRPALYGAKYEALVANKALEEEEDLVTIAGRYCESGDILVKDVALPTVASGDIIALPVAGAYCIPMSSNYNAVPRPAIAIVREGKARLIRRRESYRDLMYLE